MKVVVIGGSSHSTPALFDCDPPLDAAHLTFTLAGRDARRLAAVRRACELVGEAHGAKPRCETSPVAHLSQSLDGAGVVLVQIRVGGYGARAWDERFPHAYDLCGDEGLGVGGLAAAWRAWPEIEALLATVERAAPRALVLMLSSPVGILTRAAIDAFPALTTAGICELPWTTLRDACRTRDRDPYTTPFSYTGVNHLGWLNGPFANGPLPLKYVRLHDDTARVLAQQRRSAPRAHELDALAERAFDAYERKDARAICATVRERGTPWYADAVVPLIRALGTSGTSDVPFFLTRRNDGYLPYAQDDDVVEIPHRLEAGAFVRCMQTAPSMPEIEATLARLVAYERAATSAVRSRDRAALVTALRLHPWLDGKPVSPELVADIVAPADAIATVRA